MSEGLFSAERLRGQVVLITNGSARTTGIVNAFRRGGATVALTNRAAYSGAEDLALGLDTGDPAAVSEAFDTVEARLGPVAILINAPDERHNRPSAEMRLEMWRQITRTRYDGVFFCCAEFARRRIAAKKRGWILNLVDPPEVGTAAEQAAAGGVLNLVKTLGAEWARDGLRVNGIVLAHDDDKTLSAANGESLAALALYLCSPYAGFVTAATLRLGAP